MSEVIIRVTLKDGVVFDYSPKVNETIQYEIDTDSLIMRKRPSMNGKFQTFRIFAPGVWRDIEAIDVV